LNCWIIRGSLIKLPYGFKLSRIRVFLPQRF
jgi:hypothetical protein